MTFPSRREIYTDSRCFGLETRNGVPIDVCAGGAAEELYRDVTTFPELPISKENPTREVG